MKGPPHASTMKDPLLGRVIADRWRIASRIAQGGTSTVYRADGAAGALAVVKVLDPLYSDLTAMRRRFARAAALQERVDGQGAPRVLGTDEVDGRPCMIMEFADGEPLEGRGMRGAGAAGLALLHAVAQVHRAGVVHRDLKPPNALVSQGAVTLIDFGAAAEPLRSGGESADGGDELPLGTPAYAAPEQADGAIDVRCDLYAVGVILFEIACGRRPFNGDPVAVMNAHLRTAPPRPRSLAPSLTVEMEALLQRALEKDPARRFGSAGEMHAALAAATRGAR